MGWSGDFQIKYKGGSPKKFHKLAKMVIPNSLLRFDFDNANMNDNEVELACTRNLSWYSADKDMKKLLSYFKDGDSISMEIKIRNFNFSVYNIFIHICHNQFMNGIRFSLFSR